MLVFALLESWLRFLQRKIAIFVEGWFFEAFFASIIVTNSIFIAVQVEWASQDPGGELPFFLFVIFGKRCAVRCKKGGRFRTAGVLTWGL
eukprot:s3_g8.t1